MRNSNLSTLFMGILIVVSLGFSGNILGQEIHEQTKPSHKTQKATIDVSTLSVNGMYCAGCVARVQKAASEVEGVDKVEVSLKKNQATIEYNGDKKVLNKVVQAIEDAGYTAKPVETEESNQSKKKS